MVKRKADDSKESGSKRPKVASMSIAQLKEQLKNRGIDASGDKSILKERLKEAIDAEFDLDPEHMLVDEIRKQLKWRGLDTEGTKAVLQHRLAVEFKRASGQDTSDFNPALLTVTQLREWLEARGVKPPAQSAGKQAHVDAVEREVKREEKATKKQDIDNMSSEDIVQWLKDNKIPIPKVKKDRDFYANLMKKHVHKDVDGVLLFTEDEVIFHKKLFFGQRLVVVNGDISKCAAQAIVHPTNGHGVLGGGVGQTLAKAAPGLKAKVEQVIKKSGPMSSGECVISKGAELPATHVIHTYSPVFDSSDEDESKRALAESISNILKTAEDREIYSLALPSIGAGRNGYPIDLAAETILQAITSFFQKAGVKSQTKQIYFVLYGDHDVNVYKKHALRL